MNLQQAIHWLEQGGGARVFKLGALLLTLLAISATVAHKQFHGPRTEETLRQADLGRSLANSQGFTTSVNYPQVHAVLEKRGQLYDATERMPEVYHAPAYPLVIAGTLAVLPEGLRSRLFTEIPDPPTGFGADYLLLALNGLFLAIAAWQCWLLGRRLFDARVGLVAAVCLLVSTSIWSHVVAVDGTSLAMVLLLGLFEVLVVLIDGDMRRPTQHRLGNWQRSPGLSDYLHGKARLADILQTDAAESLDVIGSGSHAGFSFSLRHAERMRDLVAELKKTYDRVLFDSPPIIGVSDASILASCMDGVLLLIQHRRNPRMMTARAQQVLASAQTPVIGAILNQAPPDSGEDYGYYAHNYTYYGTG